MSIQTGVEQNKRLSTVVITCFRWITFDCEKESLCKLVNSKKVESFNTDGKVLHLVWSKGIYTSVLFLAQQIFCEFEEVFEFEWWTLNKINVAWLKQRLRKQSSFISRPLKQTLFLEKFKCGSLFGYRQCDTPITEPRRGHRAFFAPVLVFRTLAEKAFVLWCMRNLGRKEWWVGSDEP